MDGARWVMKCWMAIGLVAQICVGDLPSSGSTGVPALSLDNFVQDSLLAATIDAEINATSEILVLLTTKAAVLERMIQSEQARHENTETRAASRATRQRHRLPLRHEYESFDDWLAPQDPWLSPEPMPGTSRENSSELHVQLLSFRPNGNLGGKKNTHPSHLNPDDSTAPMVQFLLVLNSETGALDLLHPVTRTLLWQQRLALPSRITKVYFHSDRASHLVLVTVNNELVVYKMRVFHGRRLIAGDYRRVSGRESMVCAFSVGLARGSINAANGTTLVVDPFAVARPLAIQTIAPMGLHTHVEIEFDYQTKLARAPSQLTMAASHQVLHLVTGSESGHLSFYDGHNGTVIEEIATGLGPITHFQALSSGVFGFTVANRIHFADVFERRVLELTCDGSHHAFTSLDRDAWRHSVLYAGTAGGEVLAFRINRFGSVKRNNGLTPIGADAIDPLDSSDFGFPTCSLMALLQPRARALASVLNLKPVRPAVAAALPGYLLLATGDGRLVLYDTSSSLPGQPTYLAEKYLDSLPTASLLSQSIYATKDMLTSTAAVAVVSVSKDSRVRVELFASRLPAASSGVELGWIRAPMMLFCAFGVMFWQQNRFHRPASALDRSLEMELPGARDRRYLSRAGLTDWSKSANHRAFGAR